MRNLMKLLLLTVLTTGMSVSFADPSYVQALPSINTTDQSASVTAINSANAAANTNAADPANAQQAVAQPKHHLFSHHDQAAPAASAMDQSAQSTLLLSRVMQVNQDFLNYQSKTTDQINQLNSANQQLSHQVSTLASQLALLQTKINAAAQPQVNKGGFNVMVQQFGLMPFYIIVAIFILLLLIIILLLFSRKKAPAPVAVKEDVKSDYDYLSTKEAIPAKLDLARSYIVMEDFDAAKEVLQEVIKSGNEEQKKMAAELLKQCEATKKDG